VGIAIINRDAHLSHPSWAQRRCIRHTNIQKHPGLNIQEKATYWVKHRRHQGNIGGIREVLTTKNLRGSFFTSFYTSHRFYFYTCFLYLWKVFYHIFLLNWKLFLFLSHDLDFKSNHPWTWPISSVGFESIFLRMDIPVDIQILGAHSSVNNLVNTVPQSVNQNVHLVNRYYAALQPFFLSIHFNLVNRR